MIPVTSMRIQSTNPVLRVITLFAVIFLLLGSACPAGAERDEEFFRFRLDRLRPSDHAGLLRLGIWCEEKNHPPWARTCYRRVVDLGETASYQDGCFRLARVELSLGKRALAFRRLRELSARF